MAERLLRAGWGALLVAAPHRLMRAGGVDTRGVRDAARLLGARHLGEVLLLSCAHGERPRRWVAAADALHGASMLGLAALSPRMRRDALTSATATALLMGLAFVER